MCLPSCMAASAMHDTMRRPSICTVQAPHSPRSQPFFVPVSPSSSRNASSSVMRGSTISVRAWPLTTMLTGTRAALGSAVCSDSVTGGRSSAWLGVAPIAIPAAADRPASCRNSLRVISWPLSLDAIVLSLNNLGLLSIQQRDLCGRDALKGEPIGQAFLEPAAKAIRQRHPRVSQRERVLLLHMPCQFPSSRQQSFTRNNFVHGAILLRLGRAQFLAAQQEIPAANFADDFRPHDMQTVTRHDAERGMRCVLKVGPFGGNDDVAEQGILGMRRHRTIDGGDHRHFYIENVFEDLCALAKDLVVSGRGEEIETLGRDLGAEFVARPGQDDYVVLGIIADVAERPNQRFVHVAVEHQRAASRMQGDLQNAVFALHPD